MKKLLTRLVVLALLLCCASPAFAGVRSGAFTLSPMLGYLIFDDDQGLDDSFLGGAAAAYSLTKNVDAELFLGMASPDTNGGGDADTTLLRLDGLYHFMTDQKLVPYLALGVGQAWIDLPGNGDLDSFLVNWGGGVKYFLSDDWALRADARHMITTEGNNGMLALTAGVSYLLGGAAAPVPPLDSDGDGVIDSTDQCPNTPAGEAVNSSGCPLDSDADGVIDSKDQCPGTPAGVKVDARGCPLDSDADGVADYLDKCPGTPAGIKVDAKGCPVDSDADGVTDDLDQCPGTPAGELVNEVGCPLKFTLQIKFDSNKADIKPDFKADLDKAAAFVQQHDKVPYILLAGHTDSQGAADYNQQLSQRRAEAVRQYLIDNYGIDGKRLVARGYGEQQPIASNDTAEGRYQNRRVELVCCAVLPN